MLAPLLVLISLRGPLTAFYQAFAAELWPWLLAWSGWRCQCGTLEVKQIPAYMTGAAALPARLPARWFWAWWAEHVAKPFWGAATRVAGR